MVGLDTDLFIQLFGILNLKFASLNKLPCLSYELMSVGCHNNLVNILTQHFLDIT